MNLLLDTHVLLWTQLDTSRLGSGSQFLLADQESRLYLSTFSVLEISQLVSCGRLKLNNVTSEWIAGALKALRCEEIGLSREVALGAYQLPGTFHRDPADRILVSTARVHGLTLVTADRRILRYRGVKTLDIRK